ncbi:MAG: TIR domain-containing protein [Desulfocapsaceae bacterium]|nr:TIR domain-containing protein [Desulfocapsaceae bacterium]
MDVFISWSGKRSFQLATSLKEWLPLVIQTVTPWFSPEDIDKGARWMAELSKQLEKLKMGIICVTPENMQAPWLLFEAGALSKVLDTSLVCPFLFALEPVDLQGPLAQFQSTRSTKEDVRKLLTTINKNTEQQLTESQIDRIFSVLWPDFEEKLRSIESSVPDQASSSRPVPELLSEVLERVRSIERQLAEGKIPNGVIASKALKIWEQSKNRENMLKYGELGVKLHVASTNLNKLQNEREQLEKMVINASESTERALDNQLKKIICLETEAIKMCERLHAEQSVLAMLIGNNENDERRMGS